MFDGEDVDYLGDDFVLDDVRPDRWPTRASPLPAGLPRFGKFAQALTRTNSLLDEASAAAIVIELLDIGADQFELGESLTASRLLQPFRRYRVLVLGSPSLEPGDHLLMTDDATGGDVGAGAGDGGGLRLGIALGNRPDSIFMSEC